MLDNLQWRRGYGSVEHITKMSRTQKYGNIFKIQSVNIKKPNDYPNITIQKTN